MYVCTSCGKSILTAESFDQPVQTEQMYSDLVAFVEQMPHPKPVERDLSTRRMHRVSSIEGERRKGVIGGFHFVQRDCGPLRPETSDECAAREAEERAVAGLGRFRGRPVLVLGQEKGATTEARLRQAMPLGGQHLDQLPFDPNGEPDAK